MQYKNGSRDQGSEESYGLGALRRGGSHIARAEVKAEVAKNGGVANGSLEGGKPTQNDTVNLQRRVGLLSGVALIVGTMIGSGIFVSPKGVLERSGSAGLSLIVWFACGLLSLLGALCYVELGCLIPSSGAEHTYFLAAFGHLPSFLFAWVTIVVLKPSMLAIICLSFSKYLVEAFSSECEPPLLAIQMISALTIVLITFINSFSVKLATKVQNVFTAAKLIAIVIIVIGGIVKLSQGNVQYLSGAFEGTTNRFGDVATAFYSGLWAYDGWNNLNYVTEELKNPYVNLPRSIIIGLPLVTVCYILINISYLAVMSTEELLASETVAVLFGNRLIGPVGELIMILAVSMSTFGAANGSCFTSARLCFVAAREGHMVDALSYVHARKLTPSPALLFNAMIALIMVIPSDIGSLIDFFSFTAWIFYGGAMLALIVMRRTKKDVHRPYTVPIIIPWIVLLISIYLVIGPIIDSPQIEYLYATVFILAGVIFYVPFVYYKKSVPGMGHLTTFFQLLLEVIPTDVVPDAA